MPPRFPGQYPPFGPMPPGAPRQSFGGKVVLLGLQAVVLMIAAFVVWGMVDSREYNNNSVAGRIASEWGGPVSVNGPIVSLGDSITVELEPQAFTAEASVSSETLHRSIYEAEVFRAHVKIDSKYRGDSLASIPGDATVTIMVNTANISNLTPLKIGGRTVDWDIEASSLTATVPAAELAGADIKAEFDIRGSGSIEFRPLCRNSRISIEGEARNPSFTGGVSPDRRDIWSSRFSAMWVNPQRAVESDSGGCHFIGTSFLVGVDRYQKVSRSIKYAFIIILLTYITVIFTEITMKHTIPMLNYFLIGAALVLFYCLLLALSERMTFGWAYLVAMAMTVGLITGYMWRMLKSRKVGLVMGCILLIIYTSCYIMLCVSSYALLMGSLLLFCALAGLMYGSLRIQAEKS